MATRPPGMTEFAGTLGETQRPSSGDRIMALARPPLPSPPSPQAARAAAQARAAAMPPQVLSVFDARPVSAYDFATGFATTNALEPAVPAAGRITCPDGFTMIVRRIEIDPDPPFSGGDGTSSLMIRLTRDDVPIQLNEIQLFGGYSEYTWDTYQVVGQGHTFGASWEVVGTPTTGVTYILNFRVFGTLMRTRGLPPELEVGSGPLNIRG